MVGQTISHYKITEKLGEGGMGVVYKAEDTKLERTVALKFLAAHLVGDDEGRERFLREAKAAAALDHNNICTVYEIDEVEGKTFIAMAFIEGPSLKDKIAERPLKLDEALDLAIQTARGLEAAHNKGIVHRDIKPANLMLTGDATLKIMDFGLAQLAGRTKLTKTGSSLGTPAYMSPEQTLGGKVDRRSDIWSLGVVLYEMVTGQLPFKGDVEAAVAYSIVNAEQEPLTALRAGVPLELDRVVAKALSKAPENRYQHADEMMVDLRSLRTDLSSGSAQSASTAVVQPARQRATMWLVATVAVTALAGVGGLAWWLSRASDDTLSVEPLTLTRLTTDSGLSHQPAISPDGNLVAYASDRAGENNLDIWVQQIEGGEPMRLTSDPADDYLPSFSPDGGTVAFRSFRKPGGVYTISTLGGTERLIAPRGTSPRFSPDGTQLAFATFGKEFRFRLFVTPATGGEPKQLAPEFVRAHLPVWSPDGQHIYFQGKPAGETRLDLFRIPAHGGTPSATGLGGYAKAAGVNFDRSLRTSPFTFLDSETLLMSGGTGNHQNLWEIRIDPGSGQVTGLKRKTFGTAIESAPSASMNGRIVFASLLRNTDVWSLPFDPVRAEALGKPVRVTSDLAQDHSPSVSWNGEKVVFTSDRSGNRDLWVKDLTTGHLTALTATPYQEHRGITNPDGTQVAFSTFANESEIYVMSLEGGLPQKLCADCGLRPVLNHWLRDGTKLLYYRRPSDGGRADRYHIFNVDNGKSTEILAKRPRPELLNIPEISPDGRWAAFSMSTADDGDPIFIAALGGGHQAESDSWIQITDGNQIDRKPFWSPKGDWVYYSTGGGGRGGGFKGLRGQRLHPDTKQPIGEPKNIYPLFGGRFMPALRHGALAMSPAHDRVLFSMIETTGNIWMAEPQAGP